MSDYAFDAAAILGLGPSTDPLPQPEPGEFCLYVPAALTLQALRDSPAGKELMDPQHWYDRHPWSSKAPVAGVYRLRIPVPGSQHKVFAEQQAMLAEGEEVAPAVLVAAALLCLKRQGAPDPVGCRWTRCAEQAAENFGAELTWCAGRLSVYTGWRDDLSIDVFVSALRRA